MDAVRWYRRSGARPLPGRAGWPAPATGSGSSADRGGVADLSRLRRRTRTLPLPSVVVAIVVAGVALRLVAALVLTPHVDEAASLLAAEMVVERGLPILPSGTVYFQGGTLSYLLAPVVALGADTLGDLERLRLLCALAGATSVALAFGLARAVAGDARAGVFAAALVALDPVAVQWSAHLRMYALLQPLTLAFAWLVVGLATEGVNGRRLAGLVGLAWALTFTHVAALALWPPAALALAIAHRGASWSVRLRLGLAGLLCALAPLTLLTLNRTLGSASVSNGKAPSGLTPSFVGDHLLALRRFSVRRALAASPEEVWAAFPSPTTFAWLLPVLVLLVAGLVATRRVLRSGGGLEPARRARLAILLGLGWLPAAVVWLGSPEPRARYVVHIHAIGWVVLATLAAGMLVRFGDWFVTPAPVRWRRLAVLLVAPVVLATGLGWRLAHPIVHPDHVAALVFVAERRGPDQPVVVALPAAAYLTPGTEDGMVFLAGPADRPRAERLTRLGADGELTDYWVGAPAITSEWELRRFLVAHPDAWIVVDESRLDGNWAYAGPIADLLRRETRVVYEGPGEVLVLRPRSTIVAAPVSANSP